MKEDVEIIEGEIILLAENVIENKENLTTLKTNVKANEASIDANKHQLVSCFCNQRDVTNNIKNHPVITLNRYTYFAK